MFVFRNTIFFTVFTIIVYIYMIWYTSHLRLGLKKMFDLYLPATTSIVKSCDTFLTDITVTQSLIMAFQAQNQANYSRMREVGHLVFRKLIVTFFRIFFLFVILTNSFKESYVLMSLNHCILSSLLSLWFKNKLNNFLLVEAVGLIIMINIG